MGNKTSHTIHQQDYIPATRNEDKNAEHKRAKREFRLAASSLASSTPEEDDYFDTGFWTD